MRPIAFTSIFASGLGSALALMLPLQSVAAQPGSTVSSEVAAYPSIEVLNAFREGCGEIKNQASTSTNLTANGWITVPNVDTTPLNAFLSIAREAGARANESLSGSMSEMEVFEKTIAGEHVYITLSEVKLDGLRITGCRLFDPSETRTISVEIASQWLAAKPVRATDRKEVQIADWEPGILPSHDSFQLFFVPSDSPFKSTMKFDGIALKSDTVGVVK